MADKIKVGFYMDNKNFLTRDLHNIEAGNPGIGGSQYMQLLTVSYLASEYEDLEIILYVTAEQPFPENVEIRLVKDVTHAIACMKHDKCKVFVMSNWYGDLGSGTDVLQMIEKYRIRTIIWAHIFMNREQYAYIASCKYIRLFVCLGKQQLEMQRGSKLYKKATYINYMLSPVNMFRQNQNEKIVVYVGALYPYKGFHILAKHWREIKKNVKGAKLWVIGSAKLYGDHVSLGRYGIAEASYEKQFIHYLLNSNGQIDDSVTFFGNLGGSEKEKIVSQATVGVFNPSGNSETFGLSGVEFEAMGIPVVSIYKNSALDIIKHKKTGLLYKKEEEFPEYVIRLLNDETYNHLLGEQGKAFVSEEFDSKKIVQEWHEAICCVAMDLPYKLKHSRGIMKDNQIWLHHIDNFLRENTNIKNFFWESKIVTGS